MKNKIEKWDEKLIGAYGPNMYTVPGRMGAKLAQSVNYATTGC